MSGIPGGTPTQSIAKRWNLFAPFPVFFPFPLPFLEASLPVSFLPISRFFALEMAAVFPLGKGGRGEDRKGNLQKERPTFSQLHSLLFLDCKRSYRSPNALFKWYLKICQDTDCQIRCNLLFGRRRRTLLFDISLNFYLWRSKNDFSEVINYIMNTFQKCKRIRLRMFWSCTLKLKLRSQKGLKCYSASRVFKDILNPFAYFQSLTEMYSSRTMQTDWSYLFTNE